MMEQMANRKVWYYSKNSDSLRCVASVIPIMEGSFSVVKTITIQSSGAVDIVALQSSHVSIMFGGHNRIATKKQIQKCFARVYSVLDGDTGGFISKWEDICL